MASADLEIQITHVGLTKRELFAAMVLQGMYSNDRPMPTYAPQWAVEAADALLGELAKEQP